MGGQIDHFYFHHSSYFITAIKTNVTLKYNPDGPFDIIIGNRELMDRHGITVTEVVDQSIREHEEKGRTGVLVAVNGRNILEDTINLVWNECCV